MTTVAAPVSHLQENPFEIAQDQLRQAPALEQATVGLWTGPIQSAYGAHYVRVSERTPAATPQLSEVRDAVVREWENARRRRARDDSYATMRRGYDVDVEGRLPEQP